MRFNAPFGRTASQNLNACNWQSNFMNYDSNHNMIRMCKPNIITCRVDEYCMVLGYIASHRIESKIKMEFFGGIQRQFWNYIVKLNGRNYYKVEHSVWILDYDSSRGITNEYLHITRTTDVFLDVSIQMRSYI